MRNVGASEFFFRDHFFNSNTLKPFTVSQVCTCEQKSRLSEFELLHGEPGSICQVIPVSEPNLIGLSMASTLIDSDSTLTWSVVLKTVSGVQ